MTTFYCYFFSCYQFYTAYPQSRRQSEISNMKYKHCYIPLELIFANFVSLLPFIPCWLLLCLGSLIIILLQGTIVSLGDFIYFPSPCCHFCLACFFHYVVLQLDISLFNLDCIDKDEDFNCICRKLVHLHVLDVWITSALRMYIFYSWVHQMKMLEWIHYSFVCLKGSCRKRESPGKENLFHL